MARLSQGNGRHGAEGEQQCDKGATVSATDFWTGFRTLFCGPYVALVCEHLQACELCKHSEMQVLALSWLKSFFTTYVGYVLDATFEFHRVG